MTTTSGSGATGSSSLAELGLGAVRWSFRSPRYEATVAYYRDLVGLPVIAEFSSSYGEDGTVVGLPDASVHLEILRERPGDTSAVDQNEIVLYLNSPTAVAAATTRLREAGAAPDPDGHPYWEANGAATYRDPDGRAVVFAPWVFGRVPDPVDRSSDGNVLGGHDGELPQIGWYDRDPETLRALFEQAEDSQAQLDSYLRDGRLLVAQIGEAVVGHLQLIETARDAEIELKSMAVTPHWRGTGIGTRLVEHALATARTDGYHVMVVATAAADIDNLRFYQRRGFRLTAVEPDAFNAESGYPAGITIDGIPLRDRVWFAQPLRPLHGGHTDATA